MNYLQRAERIQERLQQLGTISELPTELYRSYGSEAMGKANALVEEWMSEVGLVRKDEIGNIHCMRPGNDGYFLIGSHLDTVRNAGKYDGPLGVLLGIEAARDLNVRYGLLLIGFCDEEGARFHSTYLGSATVAGNPPDLSLLDAHGISLREAIRAFGGDPEKLAEARLSRSEIIGYLEAHIEQGPVLQHLNLPLGVVSGIFAQNRLKISFEGNAGHAGTVPMELRRDALCGASEFILEVEKLGLDARGLVATVGTAKVEPGASNVIPGRVAMTLDLRHGDDATLATAEARLREIAEKIAEKRALRLRWELVQSSLATQCDPVLTSGLESAVLQVQSSAPSLGSGAGHDAVAMAALCPVAMLFVRCKDGISHHPDESVTTPDIAAALEAMVLFLRRMQLKYSGDENV